MLMPEAKAGWTPVDLFVSGTRVSAGRSKPKPSGLMTLRNIVPYVGTKSTLFQLLHVGVTLPWMTYQVDIMASDVQFFQDKSEAPVGTRLVEIKYQDLSVLMAPLDLRKNRVRVRCACPDFYFTFAYYNYMKGAIFGSKPKQYVRKTIWNPTAPPGQRGYPPRNPGQHPGMCKHCANSIQLMQQKGWVSNSTRLF
jgi:hypothetical protein